MKHLVRRAALITIAMYVVLALAIGTASKPLIPLHTMSGVHGYAHVNCTHAQRFLC
jgi:hypothetical protein